MFDNPLFKQCLEDDSCGGSRNAALSSDGAPDRFGRAAFRWRGLRVGRYACRYAAAHLAAQRPESTAWHMAAPGTVKL